MDRCLVLDAGRRIALDVPGTALAEASSIANLPAPTLVRLAQAARIDLSSAFDEGAIAAGLLARRGQQEIAAAVAARAVPDETREPAWTPTTDRPPVRVAIEDLVHRYPSGIEAVRGVSLVIEPGEGVAVLGQNGSGKTTLVKHLNGLLRRPRAGSCSMDDRPTADRSPSWPPPSGSSSRTRTNSSSNARRARGLVRPPEPRGPGHGHRRARDEQPQCRRPARRTHDQSVRPRPLPPQAGRPGRCPRHGPGDPRAGRADDRPGRRRGARVGAVVEAMRLAGRTVWPSLTTWSSRRRASAGSSSCATGQSWPTDRRTRLRAERPGPPGVDRPDPAARGRVAARMGLDLVPLDAAGLLGALSAPD